MPAAAAAVAAAPVQCVGHVAPATHTPTTTHKLAHTRSAEKREIAKIIA